MFFCYLSCPFPIKSSQCGTSLVVHWLTLRLAVQGALVRSLVGELRSHMPPGPKKQSAENRSNIVTRSVKTLKIVHINNNNNNKKS